MYEVVREALRGISKPENARKILDDMQISYVDFTAESGYFDLRIPGGNGSTVRVMQYDSEIEVRLYLKVERAVF